MTGLEFGTRVSEGWRDGFLRRRRAKARTQVAKVATCMNDDDGMCCNSGVAFWHQRAMNICNHYRLWMRSQRAPDA